MVALDWEIRCNFFYLYYLTFKAWFVLVFFVSLHYIIIRERLADTERAGV